MSLDFTEQNVCRLSTVSTLNLVPRGVCTRIGDVHVGSSTQTLRPKTLLHKGVILRDPGLLPCGQSVLVPLVAPFSQPVLRLPPSVHHPLTGYPVRPHPDVSPVVRQPLAQLLPVVPYLLPVHAARRPPTKEEIYGDRDRRQVARTSRVQ